MENVNIVFISQLHVRRKMKEKKMKQRKFDILRILIFQCLEQFLTDCTSQSYYFYKYSIKDGKRQKITIEEESASAYSVYFLKRSYIIKISKCVSAVSKQMRENIIRTKCVCLHINGSILFLSFLYEFNIFLQLIDLLKRFFCCLMDMNNTSIICFLLTF